MRKCEHLHGGTAVTVASKMPMDLICIFLQQQCLSCSTWGCSTWQHPAARSSTQGCSPRAALQEGSKEPGVEQGPHHETVLLKGTNGIQRKTQTVAFRAPRDKSSTTQSGAFLLIQTKDVMWATKPDTVTGTRSQPWYKHMDFRLLVGHEGL